MEYRKLNVKRSTSTAHRLMHYDGVCGNVHGHNMKWDIDLIVRYDPDEPSHMPLDFKKVSDTIDQIDHAILLNEDDVMLDQGIEWAQSYLGNVIPFKGDPTCEHLAQWMATEIYSISEVVDTVELKVSETDKYTMEAMIP